MVSRGARHLVLLSRSGPKSDTAQELIRELQGKDVEIVAPACDVSDRLALQRVFSGIQKTLPPVKGCIQATVALRVSCLLMVGSLLTQD